MIRVVAINNEEMWIDESKVVMIGPLMDRGVAQLGRAVLYSEGLPPLPVKEIRADIAERVAKGIIYGVVAEGEADSGGADGSTEPGSEARLVVEA